MNLSINDALTIIMDNDGGVYFRIHDDVVLVLTQQEMNDVIAVYQSHKWKQGVHVDPKEE